jgi:hypothetical protein
MRRSAVVLAALGWALAMTGCTTNPSKPDAPRESDRPTAPAPVQPQTSPPADEVAVLAADHAGELAIGVSQALYDQAPVVVLADAGDPATQQDAADRASGLGVPLLLTPAAESGPEGDDTGLREELSRLAPQAVLTYGGPATGWAQQLAATIQVVPGDAPAPAPAPTPSPEATTTMPPLAPPEPLTGLVVLTAGEERALAATATARAAGARILVTGATDPRTDPEVIAALAGGPPTHTLALGSDFGPADLLRERLAVAATGVELPGGGQVVYPGRRIVALYGHPGNDILGVLGEQSRDETITRAQKVAADYEPLVDEPVVPALEIITTIASASAGPAGDYSRRTPIDRLRGWVDAAAEAGLYVVLDLQPGRTDFLTQAKEYEELLRESHVGLALDPEWRLASDQRHMEQIGSVDAAEINQVVEWLADLTAQHHLPQKLLVLHQFTLRMITDRHQVETGRDELAVLIHADGFGGRAQKLNTWRALHGNPPPRVWWGWKNFYDEDRPTFTPAQTVAVSPSPVFVSYQ